MHFRFVTSSNFSELVNNLKQNKLTYKPFWISILVCIPLFLGAQRFYSESPDSIRKTIRLTTYLLLEANELATQEQFEFTGNHIPFAFIVDSAFEVGPFLKGLSEHQKIIPMIIREKAETSYQLPGLISISFNELDTISINFDNKDSLDYDKFTINELLLTTLKGDAFDQDSIIQLWSITGKQPNFILVEKQRTKETIGLINHLNSIYKGFGVVRSEGQLLPDVSWKDFPKRKTNGYFSFPDLFPLSPYKAGYQFSPDIMLDSPLNRKKLKEFNALKLHADYKLNDHFSFYKKVENLKRDNENEILNNGVQIVPDKVMGSVAHFPGQAYIDGGIQSRSVLKSNFSITAWIKPTRLDNNNSILGKGKNFVLKIQKGALTYTMQGIKDYFSGNAMIPVNQWTFISVVHSAYENQMRFYLNGEQVDEISLINKYEESDYTLLIGSNLWEEFFVGYIAEIKIWERELNNDEIKGQYVLSLNSSNKKLILVKKVMFVALIVVIGLLVLLISKKKKGANRKIKKETTVLKIHESNASEKIYCFGGLQVINHDGLDVAQRFSPKLKQLFVLIFLHSINGQKGINSTKLSAYLWPGMDPRNVKNTRGTNIQKLKAALEPCSEIKLLFRDKHWFIEMSDSCYVDYSHVLLKLSSLKEPNDENSMEENLLLLLSILKRGTLFPNMTESWIDPYISKISDQIIELGLKLFQELDDSKQALILYELAEVISINDPLNEPALQKKLTLLTLQGKLGLARSVYDNFAKLYFELYQEDYPVDFKTSTLLNP